MIAFCEFFASCGDKSMSTYLVEFNASSYRNQEESMLNFSRKNYNNSCGISAISLSSLQCSTVPLLNGTHLSFLPICVSYLARQELGSYLPSKFINIWSCHIF